MGQSRDSDLAVWPAKRARFLGTKHTMVFAGGWYVWRNNPLRGPFFWAQNTLWCSRAVVMFGITTPYGPFFGHKTRYGVRGRVVRLA